MNGKGNVLFDLGNGYTGVFIFRGWGRGCLSVTSCSSWDLSSLTRD